MSNFIPLTTGTEDGASGSSWILVIAMYAILFVALYFILIRPQSKKKKKEEAMRKGVRIGDEITTIGGICGRVISIKDETDTLVIETGIDRDKVRIKRWAVGSVDTIHDDGE